MDTEEYEFEEPKPKKPKLKKDPHADLEKRVREFVLTTDEDWLVPKFVSQHLRSGEKHVAAVMDAMAEEGVLSPLAAAPFDEEVKVGVRPIADGFYHVCAFRHANRWVIGYFSKSAADARKTVLIHGKPKYESHRPFLGYSRARAGRLRTRGHRVPTPRMREEFANSFRYKAADWDGLAHRIHRDSQAFADACTALSLHRGPWTCSKCKHKNDASYPRCHGWSAANGSCKELRPKFVAPKVEHKICPRCGEPDVDGHSKRHRGKVLKASKEACTQKMVEKVHKM